MCLLLLAPLAATTTRLLRSLIACFALVSLLVARTLARVTVAAPLLTRPKRLLVSFHGALGVLKLASLVYTPGLVLFLRSSPATCKKVETGKDNAITR
jgi:hypothetical protein